MKHLLRAVLAFVLFYLVYDKLFARYLPQSHVWSKIVWPSALMLLPFFLVFGLLYNLRTYSKIRRSDKAVPQDGKWIALTGTISPAEECLQSPLTKKDCVAYSYSVSSYEFATLMSKTTKRGEMSWQRRYFGYARVPWILKSGVVNAKMAHFFGTTSTYFKYPPEDSVVANARQFLDGISFEKRKILGTELLEFPEKDARKDWISTHDTPVPDLKGCQLEEKYLPVGQECLVSGTWSNDAQTLTTDVMLYPGTRIDVLRGIRRNIITQIIMIPFLTLFINFFFYNVFQQ